MKTVDSGQWTVDGRTARTRPAAERRQQVAQGVSPGYAASYDTEPRRGGRRYYRARRAWLCTALGILTATSLTVTGCSTFNFSPLHSALSEPELQRRIDRRFPVGTPKTEVVGRLERMDLDPHETPSQLKKGPNEDSVQVWLEAPWWYLQLLTRRMTFIRFQFDSESNLESTHIEQGAIGL